MRMLHILLKISVRYNVLQLRILSNNVNALAMHGLPVTSLVAVQMHLRLA